jgi:nucleoside-diphosphate-sugar epimerase
MKLKNKNIIITGGSGIIGKAIIKNMKDHGAYVINLDIINYSDDNADRFIKLNITDYDQVRKIITEVI